MTPDIDIRKMSLIQSNNIYDTSNQPLYKVLEPIKANNN